MVVREVRRAPLLLRQRWIRNIILCGTSSFTGQSILNAHFQSEPVVSGVYRFPMKCISKLEGLISITCWEKVKLLKSMHSAKGYFFF